MSDVKHIDLFGTTLDIPTGEDITVDSALSDSSTNPVENRVIKNGLDNKQDRLIAGNNISIEGNVISASGGGGSISVDSTLSNSSTNPVENRVIKNALDNKQDTLTAGNHISITNNVISAEVDNALSDTSTNPVENNVVKGAIDDLGTYIDGNYVHRSGDKMTGGLITNSLNIGVSSGSYATDNTLSVASDTDIGGSLKVGSGGTANYGSVTLGSGTAEYSSYSVGGSGIAQYGSMVIMGDRNGSTASNGGVVIGHGHAESSGFAINSTNSTARYGGMVIGGTGQMGESGGIAIGTGNSANNNSVGVGSGNTTTDSTVAVGTNNSITGAKSYALGWGNINDFAPKTTSGAMVLIGDENQGRNYTGGTSGEANILIGHGLLNTSHDGTVVVGSYNVDRDNGGVYLDLPTFIVGCGTSDSERKDGLVVKSNGQILNTYWDHNTSSDKTINISTEVARIDNIYTNLQTEITSVNNRLVSEIDSLIPFINKFQQSRSLLDINDTNELLSDFDAVVIDTGLDPRQYRLSHKWTYPWTIEQDNGKNKVVTAWVWLPFSVLQTMGVDWSVASNTGWGQITLTNEDIFNDTTNYYTILNVKAYLHCLNSAVSLIPFYSIGGVGYTNNGTPNSQQNFSILKDSGTTLNNEWGIILYIAAKSYDGT